MEEGEGEERNEGEEEEEKDEKGKEKEGVEGGRLLRREGKEKRRGEKE